MSRQPHEAQTAEEQKPIIISAEDAENLLLDPISRVRMTDPVTACDGHTYDRKSIQSWIDACKSAGRPVTSPLTGLVLPNHELRDNLTMRQLLGIAPMPRRQHAAGAMPVPAAAERPMVALSPHSVFRAPREQVIQVNVAEQVKFVQLCELGDFERVRIEIKHNNSINLRVADSRGIYPLGAAIASLNFELAECLVDLIKPDADYMQSVLAANEVHYRFRIAPEFKAFDRLTCHDMYNGYFAPKTGRHPVLSKSLWQRMGCPQDAWHTIENRGNEVHAITYSACDWTFVAGDRTFKEIAEDLFRHEDARAVVWAAFLQQYSFCAAQRNLVYELVHKITLAQRPEVAPAAGAFAAAR